MAFEDWESETQEKFKELEVSMGQFEVSLKKFEKSVRTSPIFHFQEKGESILLDSWEKNKSCTVTIGENLGDYFTVNLKMQKVIEKNGNEIIQVICPMEKTKPDCLKTCSVKKLADEVKKRLGINMKVEFLEGTLPSEISGKEIVPFDLAFEKQRVKDKMENRKILGSLEVL